MSTPLPDSAPEPTEKTTPVPIGNKCFTCDPSDGHERAWIPQDGPKERTLVLCFDGTKDSFDQDVSQLSNPSYLIPETE